MSDEDVHEVSLAAFSERAEGSHEKSMPPADLLRVEEDLPMSWSGVSSCCDRERIDNECKAQFDSWLGRQVSGHPGHQMVNYGHGGGSVRCSQSNSGWPDNRRSCRAGVTVRAFAEFVEK